MSILRKSLLLMVLTLFIKTVSAQQDPLFNLGFFNYTHINPAYAGSNMEGLFSAMAINRVELKGFDGAPVTTIVNCEGPISLFGIESGVGLTLYNEKIGYMNAPGVSLSYAYRHAIDKGSLGIGFSAGILNSWFSETNWRLPDEGTDASIPTQKEGRAAFDAGLGVFYSHPRWYAGISCTHLNTPALGAQGYVHKKPILYANGGYTVLLDSTRWVVKPMLNVESDFVATRVSLTGTAWYEGKYWGGISYRWKEAIIFMLGMDLLEGLKIAYAFDYTTSKLNKFSDGTHEIMLNYSFSLSVPRGAQKYKSIRYL